MCTVVPIRPEHGMRSSERQVGAAMCVLGAATWILDTECGSPTGVAITPSHRTIIHLALWLHLKRLYLQRGRYFTMQC